MGGTRRGCPLGPREEKTYETHTFPTSSAADWPGRSPASAGPLQVRRAISERGGGRGRRCWCSDHDSLPALAGLVRFLCVCLRRVCARDSLLNSVAAEKDASGVRVAVARSLNCRIRTPVLPRRWPRTRPFFSWPLVPRDWALSTVVLPIAEVVRTAALEMAHVMTSLAAASHRLPELLCCRQGTPNTLLGVGIALRDTLSQSASQPASRPGPGCLVLVGSIWAIRVTRPSRRPMWAPRKIDALRPRGLASDSDVSVHGQSSCHEGGGRCVSLGPSPSRRKVVGGRSHGWPDVVAGGSQRLRPLSISPDSPRACQGKQGWLLPMSLVAPRSAVWASANQACVLRECFVRILKKIPGLMIVDENGKRRGSEGRGREEKQAGLDPEAYDTRDRGFGRNLERGGADPPTYLALLLLVAGCSLLGTT